MQYIDEISEDEPTAGAKAFYDMLAASKEPLHISLVLHN
jgi:hypothetical protein